ncbi:MAG: polymer-forming cytoskeletal protein [Rhodoferax sp.]|nr:polymer-forming cytoskeletal protein [Rhodoferax sp.]
MFNKGKQPPIKSLIAEGTEIQGNLSFSEGLRVDGTIVGNVIAAESVASILVVSDSACIVGAINADHVVINGTVKGPIHARSMLELQPKARIEGDIDYAALEMHQGALIAGQLRPLVADEEKPTLKLAANNQ